MWRTQLSHCNYTFSGSSHLTSGSCFQFLLGQKYGEIQIPIRLPLYLYELFQSTMKRHKRKFSVDHTFLNLYYKLDSNTIEPEMVLIGSQERFSEIPSDVKENIFRRISFMISSGWRSNEDWNLCGLEKHKRGLIRHIPKVGKYLSVKWNSGFGGRTEYFYKR